MDEWCVDEGPCEKLSPEEVRSLLYKEILEYHPQAKREFEGGETASSFMYPSGAGGVGAGFAAAEEAAEEGEGGGGGGGGGGGTVKGELRRSAQSLPRESVQRYRDEAESYMMGGAGALKRSDSIHVTTPGPVVQQADIDEMMDAAESMSLDDKELAEAAEQAHAMMMENQR